MLAVRDARHLILDLPGGYSSPQSLRPPFRSIPARRGGGAGQAPMQSGPRGRSGCPPPGPAIHLEPRSNLQPSSKLTPHVAAVRDVLAACTKIHYDSVLINLYPDGRCVLTALEGRPCGML